MYASVVCCEVLCVVWCARLLWMQCEWVDDGDPRKFHSGRRMTCVSWKILPCPPMWVRHISRHLYDIWRISLLVYAVGEFFWIEMKAELWVLLRREDRMGCTCFLLQRSTYGGLKSDQNQTWFLNNSLTSEPLPKTTDKLFPRTQMLYVHWLVYSMGRSYGSIVAEKWSTLLSETRVSVIFCQDGLHEECKV